MYVHMRVRWLRYICMYVTVSIQLKLVRKWNSRCRLQGQKGSDIFRNPRACEAPIVVRLNRLLCKTKSMSGLVNILHNLSIIRHQSDRYNWWSEYRTPKTPTRDLCCIIDHTRSLAFGRYDNLREVTISGLSRFGAVFSRILVILWCFVVLPLLNIGNFKRYGVVFGSFYKQHQ